MAAPKRPTHVVVHPKLYMAPNGKLEHIKAGTELVLDKKIAEKLGDKVKAIGEEKAIDMTDKDKSGDTEK